MFGKFNNDGADYTFAKIPMVTLLTEDRNIPQMKIVKEVAQQMRG